MDLQFTLDDVSRRDRSHRLPRRHGLRKDPAILGPMHRVRPHTSASRGLLYGLLISLLLWAGIGLAIWAWVA